MKNQSSTTPENSPSKNFIFDDPLLTTNELAIYLRNKPGTIIKWRRNSAFDQPPFIKTGPKSIRYKKSEVDKWLVRNPNIKQEANDKDKK